MIPAMRRNKQQLSDDQCASILREGVFGVLGTNGTDGVPYAVPLSYAYDDEADLTNGAPYGHIYLHGAPVGHKLDAIAENPHVTFAVVGYSEVVPEKFTNLYRSVIVFGQARLATNDEEKRRALQATGRKYSPGLDDRANDMIEKDLDRVTVIIVDIEGITGKEALGLMNEHPGISA